MALSATIGEPSRMRRAHGDTASEECLQPAADAGKAIILLFWLTIRRQYA